MIAHIYARVSTDMQAQKGYSLQTQVDLCRQKAAELGATYIVDHVDDGFSGGDIDRPGMNSLREDLKANNIDLVICYDPDRLARNLSHQLIITDEIEKHGAKLVFVSVSFENSPEGKLFYSIRGAISAYEKEKIKERFMRGKRGKAQSGKIIQNARPYGYDFDKEKSMYVLNAESEIVKRIYEMACSGMSTAAIAQLLNANNVPTKNNKNWHPATIHRMINNTLYKGQAVLFKEKTTLVNKKKVVEKRNEDDWVTLSCPAIVTNEEFDKARSEIDKQQKFSKKNTKQVYLLQRILVCAQCGCRIKIATWKSEKYYYCSSRERNRMFNMNIVCNNHGIKTQTLDDYVWNGLQDLINNPDKIKSMLLVDQNEISYNTQIIQLHKRENDLITERDAIMKWFRHKLISENNAEKQLNDIKRNLRSISEQLTELNSYKIKSDNLDERITNFINTIKYADNRRNAVLSVLDRVDYDRVDNATGNVSNPKIITKLYIK